MNLTNTALGLDAGPPIFESAMNSGLWFTYADARVRWHTLEPDAMDMSEWCDSFVRTASSL